MSETNKYEGIVEIFEFTTAEAASVGIKAGRAVLLDIRQGTDDSGQPCALYITGRREKPVAESRPATPVGVSTPRR